MNKLIDDCFLSEFRTSVKNVVKDGNYYWHSFEDTIFFIGNDCMSADIGTVNKLLVKDIKNEDGQVWHLLEQELSGNVLMCINFHERLRKCQMHTATHVIGALIKNIYKVKAIDNGLAEDCGFVEFDLKEFNDKMMYELQVLCNGLIRDDLLINVEYPSVSEALKYKHLANSDTNPLRIVHVGTLGSICCNCMHVPSLRYLQMIFIQGYIKNGDNYRIYFTCGDQLLENVQKRYALLDNLSNRLATTHMYIPTGINALENTITDLKQDINMWVSHYVDDAITTNKAAKIVILALPECNFSHMYIVSSKLLINQQVVVLYTIVKNKINILLATNKDADFDIKKHWDQIKSAIKVSGDILNKSSAIGTCEHSKDTVDKLNEIVEIW